MNKTDRNIIRPHWALISVILILFVTLLYMTKDQFGPVVISIMVFAMVYPYRRIREIQPIVILAFLLMSVLVWWRLQALLTPFITAFVIAYALDPMVEWLEARKLPRALVTTLIISAVLGTLIGIGILIIPRLVVEVGELASNLPHWVDSSWDWGEQVFLPWVEGLNLPLEGAYSKLREHLPQMLGSFSGKLMNWSSAAISGMAGLLSGLANLILIPIITIYFLNEYNQNKSRVYSIVPMKSKELAFQLYQKLDTVLAAYIRGQLLVCSFLAIWIGLGLWLFAGLPYALLLGIAAGLANLLPYIGTSIAALLTLIVAATQPDPLVTVVKALIVFATAQFLEGNLITPRIVGNRVGLHPLVVIFSVLLFATLFGFIGLLIAIPVAASANVVVKTWINHTKLSQD